MNMKNGSQQQMNAARTIPNNVVALFSRTKDNRGSLVNFTDLLALVAAVPPSHMDFWWVAMVRGVRSRSESVRTAV